MAIASPTPKYATFAEVVERVGDIPLHRIRTHPEPGTARESDVLEIRARDDRLCELIDGILVEKTVGAYESRLAVLIATRIETFLKENNLGITLGADGMIRLL